MYLIVSTFQDGRILHAYGSFYESITGERRLWCDIYCLSSRLAATYAQSWRWRDREGGRKQLNNDRLLGDGQAFNEKKDFHIFSFFPKFSCRTDFCLNIVQLYNWSDRKREAWSQESFRNLHFVKHLINYLLRHSHARLYF